MALSRTSVLDPNRRLMRAVRRNTARTLQTHCIELFGLQWLRQAKSGA